MAGPEASPRGACDALYVSAGEDDALLSCPGRLLSERSQRLRVLVVMAFAAPEQQGGAAARALRAAGADVLRLGLAAPAPQGAGRPLAERWPEDEPCLAELAGRLDDLVLRTGARHVYLPLGVAGRAERRIAHEAGLRATHHASGRNVFLYEERPHALLPGAIRIRLGELGARLPPAAADVRDDPSMARMLLAFARAPYLAAEGLRFPERLVRARRIARALRESRSWQPSRALGLRLQPVLERLGAEDREAVLDLLAAAEPRLSALFGSRERLAADARRYAARLGSAPYVERYWLLLPPREAGGLLPLPVAETA